MEMPAPSQKPIEPSIGNLSIRGVPVNIIITNGYQIKCRVIKFETTPNTGVPVIKVEDDAGKVKYIFCHAISTIEEI